MGLWNNGPFVEMACFTRNGLKGPKQLSAFLIFFNVAPLVQKITYNQHSALPPWSFLAADDRPHVLIICVRMAEVIFDLSIALEG